MRFLSICSGIEAASVAWKPLGWEAVAFAEVEPFPCSVLKHHYPTVPNWGDVTRWETWPDESIDLLVGGTPCQSYSVAGKRGGMDDPRGQLALSFSAIAGKYRPRWVVWENVPGVLSSGRGRDFGSFLGSLAKLGYGLAYRVLDAQWFGLAQRRKRVFVVGRLGDWRPAAAVLFEPQSMLGNSPPSRKAGEGIAGTIASRTSAGGGLGTDFELGGGLQPVVGALCSDSKPGAYSGQDAYTGKLIPTNRAFGGNNTKNSIDVATAVRAKGGSGHGDFESETFIVPAMVPKALTAAEVRRTGTAHLHASSENISPSMGAKNPTAVATRMQVRRLTPTECERLQGFPDNYTQVPHRNKPAADGPRYKALGNSMAVPVMAWIGKRIQKVEDLTQP